MVSVWFGIRNSDGFSVVRNSDGITGFTCKTYHRDNWLVPIYSLYLMAGAVLERV